MRLESEVVVGWPGARAAYVLVLTVLLASLVIGAAVAGTALLSPRPQIVPGDGAFSPAGRLAQARWAHTATLLRDGRVMVLGGATINSVLGSGELWDPADGGFRVGGSLGTARSFQTATLLSDGRILVIGGSGSTGPVSSAELWHPVGQSFNGTGSLRESRQNHTATLLADGRVLVVGGSRHSGSGEATRVVDVGSAEVFDPTTGSFSPAGSLVQSRHSHSATLLDDGRVLVVGGWSESGGALASSELWDPDTGSFSLAAPPASARAGHTATLLADGRVLIVGGGTEQRSAVDSAELWDPATESFGPTGALKEARSGHTATLLPDGRVLIVGGGVPALNRFTCPEVCTATAEIWDPALDSFSSTGSLTDARMNHTATLLPDGRVLVVGGGLLDWVTGSAEVYDPMAPRP